MDVACYKTLMAFMSAQLYPYDGAELHYFEHRQNMLLDGIKSFLKCASTARMILDMRLGSVNSWGPSSRRGATMAGARRFGRQWKRGNEDRGAAPIISSAASKYTKY
jgi:hypothetical protein